MPVTYNTGFTAFSSDDAVKATLSLLRERPINKIGLEDVAARIAISVSELRERHGSWSELLVTTADQWSRQRLAILRDVGRADGVAQLLNKMIAANIEEPSIARLLSSLLTVGATPGHPLAAVINERRAEFRDLIVALLIEDIALDREPCSFDPRQSGEALTALYEVFQRRIGRGESSNACATFDAAVSRMRQNWSVRAW